jgi:hypothetical protein
MSRNKIIVSLIFTHLLEAVPLVSFLGLQLLHAYIAHINHVLVFVECIHVVPFDIRINKWQFTYSA